jgi:hypothetical protein
MQKLAAQRDQPLPGVPRRTLQKSPNHIANQQFPLPKNIHEAPTKVYVDEQRDLVIASIHTAGTILVFDCKGIFFLPRCLCDLISR